MSEGSAVDDLHVQKDTAELPTDTISFGPFRLIASQRLLLKEDKPVPLGGRALDILIALTSKAGQPVTKDELIAAVWGGGDVEDSNLKVNISTLRKALGDGEDGNHFVAHIPRRGYCFVAPVTLAKGVESPAPSANQARTNNLPQLLTKVIGRDDTISLLASELAEHRLVTIVGAGGIGKTTVALSVAKELLGSYKDGARFVDLSPVADPLQVPSALAMALHAEIHTENPTPDLLALLRESHLLLLFDCCEHVVEAVADLTVSILKSLSLRTHPLHQPRASASSRRVCVPAAAAWNASRIGRADCGGGADLSGNSALLRARRS